MDKVPLIIAVTSGKGGVGKTMLTVACAVELSYRSKTLLVDLDFFNRGLSGLFREPLALSAGSAPFHPVVIERPRFLETEALDPTPREPQIDEQSWKLGQIDQNLFHIYFPDTSNREDDALERGTNLTRQERVISHANQLRSWLLTLAGQFGFDAVVLDCHGGPDLMSFAAAFIADHILLISEPDRITLHGTLNFLRKLWRVCGDEAPDVRLVFNKVVPQFSSRFLVRFYKTLRSEFFGEKLLAIFPLELYLTKAFEQTPLLSKVYPHSLLARKMQVLLRSLLYPSKSTFLRRLTICQPIWLRCFRYFSMGKKFVAYDPAIVLNLITGLCVVFTAGAAMIRFREPLEGLLGMTFLFDRLEAIGSSGASLIIITPMAALCWLLAAALGQGTVWLSRVGIRAARRHRPFSAILWFLLLVIVWIPSSFMVGVAIQTWNPTIGERNLPLVLLPNLVLGLWFTVTLIWRSFRQIRFEPRWLEVWLQLGFVLSLFVTAVCGLKFV
jgi:cellulose biosynthesis protein BcsQ